MRWLRRVRSPHLHEITPDEALPEALYISTSDEDAFRMEVPLSPALPVLFLIGVCCLVVLFGVRSFWLQVVYGSTYAKLAKENVVSSALIPAPRAVILDRKGREVAGNLITDDGTLLRTYAYPFSLAHLIGYVSPPKRDASGQYYQWNFEGVTGVEKAYNDVLHGQDGLLWYETDAQGKVIGEKIVRAPKEAPPLQLTIDAELTNALYSIIAETVQERGFTGGSGVIIDVHTGALLAITSYPSFDQRPFGNPASTTQAARELTRPAAALLPRAWAGRYSPGSTLKPFVAVSALHHGVISPKTTIFSNGRLVVPNPYDPKKPTVYHDWGPPAYGHNDVTRALAFSSNVFFMSVVGGNPAAGIPQGVGIQRLAKDLEAFGFTESIPFAGIHTPPSLIPTPEWKQRVYRTPWRLGDTYLTAIGQFATLVTPLSLARATAALATGALPYPCLTDDSCARHTPQPLPFSEAVLAPVREGMERAVREGIVRRLDLPFVSVAAKTGTAELGSQKRFVNSLVVGYFPTEKPRYAFAVVMEHGPANNHIGGVYVMAQLFLWMRDHAPEYLSSL